MRPCGTLNGVYLFDRCWSVLILTCRYGSLERFLKEHTGVDEENVLAYLPDGQRLRTENVRDIAGSQNQVGARAV